METLVFGYGLVEAPRIDGAGNLYFSDAIDGGVYRRAPDGAVSVVVPKRRGVGGLVLHVDGGVVVSGRDVSHVREGETRVLLTVEGVLGGNPDGLAVDEAGGVWVALGSGGGIARFRPDGGLERLVAVPAPFVASLCFGGADRRDLYVTTSGNGEHPERRGTIFRTRAEVPGLVVPLARV